MTSSTSFKRFVNKNKKEKKKKKDTTEQGQLKMQGFLFQQRCQHTIQRTNQHNSDPLSHDSWDKKKQGQDKEKKKEIG